MKRIFVSVLSGQLEVLVVFAVGPVASPFESFRLEESVAEVALLYLVVELLGAVEVGFAGGWLYHFRSVSQFFVVRVVERIDVDGGSLAVL